MSASTYTGRCSGCGVAVAWGASMCDHCLTRGRGRRVPSPYKHATKLSTDARACLAAARLIWNGLSPAMHLHLVDNWRPSGLYDHECPSPTLCALTDRGLVQFGSTKLTPLGLLVREAGVHSRVETRQGDA